MKIAGISSQKFGNDNYEGELKNHYLYNDKELFDDADLDWYDYGFRNYDPQIGRFTQLDPLTDSYPELTNYQYASNDPIANIDIDGLEGGSATKVFNQVQTLQDVIVQGIKHAPAAASATSNLFKIAAITTIKIGAIVANHSEASSVINQIQSGIQSQLSAPDEQQGTTVSQCCNYFVSDLQKSINATTTSDAGYNPNGTLKPWAILTQDKTWNNFANNIVFSPAVDVAGAVTGIGEVREGLRLLGAAEKGVQFTKSSLSLGRRMHTLYKAGLADGVKTFKEFTRVKGIRPDFVDFNTKTIYELKPYNPRGIKEGVNQLNKYQKLFEKKYGGTWETVLDTY